MKTHLFILLISDLKLSNPGLLLVLRILLCNLLSNILLFLTLVLVVVAAPDHGRNREGLRVDSRPEHPVCILLIAGADGARGFVEGEAGEGDTERNQWFLLQAPAQLREPVFLIKFPGREDLVAFQNGRRETYALSSKEEGSGRPDITSSLIVVRSCDVVDRDGKTKWV